MQNYENYGSNGQSASLCEDRIDSTARWPSAAICRNAAFASSRSGVERSSQCKPAAAFNIIADNGCLISPAIAAAIAPRVISRASRLRCLSGVMAISSWFGLKGLGSNAAVVGGHLVERQLRISTECTEVRSSRHFRSPVARPSAGARKLSMPIDRVARKELVRGRFADHHRSAAREEAAATVLSCCTRALEIRARTPQSLHHR